MRDQEAVGADRGHRGLDLLHGRHPGRDDQRAAGRLHRAEQRVIGERGRRGLVARRIELLEELDGALVPRRREPLDAAVAAVGVDRAELGGAELDPVAIVDVGHPAPRRVALDQPLVARHAQLGGALLELDGVAAGEHRAVDHALCDLDRAIVIDPDLGDHVDRATIADELVTDPDVASHR